MGYTVAVGGPGTLARCRNPGTQLEGAGVTVRTRIFDALNARVVPHSGDCTTLPPFLHIWGSVERSC